MKHFLSAPRNWAWLLCGAASLCFSATVLADPPSRVARLAQIGGAVSFSPAGEEDWALAQPNRPVITGDRLWADAGSHAELQIGSAAARLGENTSVTVLNLDDTIAQFQLAQGSLNVRVRQIYGNQFYEIDTPTLAFSIRRAGDYRVDVDPNGSTTVIQVRAGQGEAWGEGTAYVIDQGQQYTFSEGMRDYRYDPVPSPDEFDRWCFDRNRREDAAVAARYVSPEVVGYSDLDEYGTWRDVQGYGTVWVPTRVAADWVPYHYGRWGWIEPWGYTWIDDAPWGFAPFHYGRWAYLSSRWCWVPGPIGVRAVYAPALVAFVGGGGFSLSIGGGPAAGIAWFPLGVGEVYRPSYTVSRNYFTNINVSNTVVNTTVVTNVYNNANVNINYRNREVAGAVTAVPATAFANGEPVSRHAVEISRDVVVREQVTHIPAVTPSHAAIFAAGAAVAGGAAVAVAAHRPPAAVLSRQVVARTEPPPPKPSFAARASLLSSQPGRPLEAERLKGMRTERAAEAPRVKMVSPSVTPRALERGQAKGAAGPGPAAGPGAQEERGARERRAGPQAGVPQPPVEAQERLKRGPQGGPPPGPAGAAQDERALRERRGGGPQGGPPGGPQGGPQGPTPQEERALKERRGGPQAGQVPQPPAAAQERFKGGPPPGGPGRAQDERALRERRGGPPQAAPQAAPPTQGGPTPQEERALRERRGGPQGPQAGPPPGPQAQPQTQERIREPRGTPPSGQAPQDERALRERRGGPPQGAPQAGPTPQAAPTPQDERALRERRGGPQGPQGGPPPGPPGQPQAQERIREPRAGPPPGQPGADERAMKERRGGGQPSGPQGGPPPQSQERRGPPPGGPPPGPPPAAPQVQRPPTPPAQAGPPPGGGPPPGREEAAKGREQPKEKGKEKDKEPPR